MPATLNSADDIKALSLAGRFGNQETFLTYCHNTHSDIILKFVLSAGGGLKVTAGSVSADMEKNDGIPVYCKLLDLRERILFERNGDKDIIALELGRLNARLSKGIYLPEAVGLDGSRAHGRVVKH